jgi:hypothetical protein
MHTQACYHWLNIHNTVEWLCAVLVSASGPPLRDLIEWGPSLCRGLSYDQHRTLVTKCLARGSSMTLLSEALTEEPPRQASAPAFRSLRRKVVYI